MPTATTWPIAAGETKTCTITNDDQPVTLHVIKHVINNDGGNNVAGDFTMNVVRHQRVELAFAGAESPAPRSR